ncbi:MAG: molybdopterin molybdotransferase MoeA [Deltaproteobacteria bacterium]|nr:molybdopterin molybdotransferase MoeA [Deltaproteobacteria bacterium]
MITHAQALETLKTAATQRRPGFARGPETVAIENCVGRVLFSDIVSPEAIPPFDNSSMDGFAVLASLTTKATLREPLHLEVSGSIAAGDAPITQSAPAIAADAWEIMTGAPIPTGYDAVVKVEDVEVKRDKQGAPQEIWISKPLTARENFRGRGEDFALGQSVARAGTRLMPEHVMALASLGLHQVAVRRKPRVALVSTGSELVAHTQKQLAPGMIRNSTAPHLIAALPSYGVECRFYGTVSDEPRVFDRLLAEILADKPDVILTTGAVSAGKYDFIPDSLKKAGATTRFHQVAIRPGKPGLFCEFENGPVVFGIPGNPVSTAVALRFFVSPYLEALTGSAVEVPLKAQLVKSAPKPEKLRCFFKAQFRAGPQGAEVLCLGGQPSFMVSPLLESNAWVVFPEGGTRVEQGTWVDVFPLHPMNYSFGSDSFASSAPKQEGCC